MEWKAEKALAMVGAWTNAQVGKYVRAIWEAERRGERNRRTLHEVGLAAAMGRARASTGLPAERRKAAPKAKVDAIFERYLEARKAHGLTGRAPILTPRRRSMIGACWRQFLAAGESPERWCSAAGLGLFLSDWHVTRGALLPENAWGKVEVATRHAERYFEARERRA